MMKESGNGKEKRKWNHNRKWKLKETPFSDEHGGDAKIRWHDIRLDSITVSLFVYVFFLVWQIVYQYQKQIQIKKNRYWDEQCLSTPDVLLGAFKFSWNTCAGTCLSGVQSLQQPRWMQLHSSLPHPEHVPLLLANPALAGHRPPTTSTAFRTNTPEWALRSGQLDFVFHVDDQYIYDPWSWCMYVLQCMYVWCTYPWFSFMIIWQEIRGLFSKRPSKVCVDNCWFIYSFPSPVYKNGVQ